MTPAELGQRLTVAQNALDAAGRLLTLQHKAVTFSGRPSADVEQQLQVVLDETRVALRQADADIGGYIDAAEQLFLDAI